ncbi:MAG: phosphate acyltransferase PlsX, partial [Oscillospiraceae bacterium]|nr:phosphate acyltransferase PlsX [Oscillospiraceae bacterium]
KAAEEFGIQMILVGRGEEVLAAMRQCGYHTLPEGVEICHADDVVDMHAEAAEVVKQHKGSSMVKGLKMLADGEGDAFISAGNTGALLSASTLLVKRIKGIRRAAFAPVLPIGKGAILVDAGANVVCTPEFLLQFGCMGSFYSQKTLGKTNPRVGLLNNGTEDSKGDELHKEAYRLLRNAGEKGLINFIGNVEAREAVGGDIDVIVADGFSGNVFLKTIEGTALYMSGLIKDMFMKNIFSKIGALLCKRGESIKKRMDYREVGGSLILGISKPVIKAHGSSNARAFRSAIKQAVHAVESDYCKDIKDHVDSMSLPKEV